MHTATTVHLCHLETEAIVFAIISTQKMCNKSSIFWTLPVHHQGTDTVATTFFASLKGAPIIPLSPSTLDTHNLSVYQINFLQLYLLLTLKLKEIWQRQIPPRGTGHKEPLHQLKLGSLQGASKGHRNQQHSRGRQSSPLLYSSQSPQHPALAVTQLMKYSYCE